MTPTPLIRLPAVAGFRNVYVKDESVHPGGTFKDRLALKALARYPASATFGALSYGNTAASFVRNMDADEHRRRFIAFLPENLSEWTFGPTTSGSTISGRQIYDFIASQVDVVRVPLDAGVLDDAALYGLMRSAGLHAPEFVNVTEGVDVPAYVDIIREATAQLGTVPDFTLVQFGAGILCNEISDFHQEVGCGQVIPFSVATAESRAKMLYGPIWLDTAELRRSGSALSRHRSPDRTGRAREPYRVYELTEPMVNQGLALAREFGLRAEPSGSAGLGFLASLPSACVRIIDPEATILLINTGNGIDSLRAAA